MKKVIFKGSGTAIVTPMYKDGYVNYDKLEALVKWQVKNGSNAIIALGTTGEASTLNEYEYDRVLASVIETVDGVIPVIAGTGTNSTDKTIERTKRARWLGANAALVVTPYYNKCSQSGLIKHYNEIADNTDDTSIILYNVPSRTGVTIEPETCFELSKHENIIAIKDAGGDISKTAKIASLCGDSLHIYSGNDDQIIPVMALGGIGVISVLSNILPYQTSKLCDLILKNNYEEARKLHFSLLPFIESLFSDINPMPIKAAMNIAGMNVGGSRAPLYGVSDDDLEVLKSHIKLLKSTKEGASFV